MNFQFKPKNLKINSQKINAFLSKNANVNFNNKKYVFKQLDRHYDNSIIASILSKDEKTKFLGIIDKINYERNNLGFQLYENNDIYFGNFKNNSKNNFGCYLFSPENENNSLLTEFYLGNFEEDQMQTNGMYLWMEELNQNVDDNLNGKEYLNNIIDVKKNYLNYLNNIIDVKKDYENDENFDNCNFSGFVGEIKENLFGNGIYFQKEGNDYKLFYGNLNVNENKNLFNENKNLFNESNLLLISNENDENIVYGKVENGKFTEGKLFIIEYDDKVEIATIKKIITFKDNVQIDEKSNNINQNEYKNILTFHDLCMEEDWFGMIFKIYQNFFKYLNNIIKNDVNFFNEKNMANLNEYLKSFNIKLLKKLKGINFNNLNNQEQQ